MNTIISTLAVAGLAVGASAQLSLNEVARIDVSGQGIGNNISSVAWNGSDLYVAGFNNTGGNADTGIARFQDALNSGNALASTFGLRDTSGQRGYSGLAINGGTLAAAYDAGGAVLGGIAAYGLDGSTTWEISARGGSGVGFDGGDVAWTTFGSGRRSLNAAGDGSVIYDSSNGMIINGAGTGTFWRDMDFASNGDIYLREGNNLIRGVRSGVNSLSGTDLLVDEVEADFVNQQNLAVVENGLGDFVVYNERANGDTASLADTLRFVDLDGNAMSVAMNFLSTVNNGNKGYDFSYDAVSGTLAVSDSANSLVYIFEVVPAPGAIAGLGLAGLYGARRRRG